MQQLAKSKNKITWQDEFRNALKTYREIESFFNLDNPIKLNYSCFIPLSFAERIKNGGEKGVLWKQFIHQEQENAQDGKLDPTGDKQKAKGSGIIHRYNSRVLFTPTTNCPIICRYCFRKNQLSSQDEIFKHNLNGLIDYLVKNPEVNEVILTGGDPLVLSNAKLRTIFLELSNLKIKFLRIHTRTPIILPSRIDDGLIELFNEFSSKFTRIIFVLHANHEEEIDQNVSTALNKLRDCSIDKKTQTVLLKDVNNHEDILIKLFYKLIDCDFTPYYLHHPDRVKGAMHFYLSLPVGREIYLKLRDKLPGWAIPHYIIDHPNGEGKQLAFNPESLKFSGKMLNLKAQLTDYTS